MSHVDGVDDGIGYGVYGFSDKYFGVRGHSNSGTGVLGRSINSTAVLGRSNYGVGVTGESSGGVGVGMYGRSDSDGGIGVYGRNDSSYGVAGSSERGVGVAGGSGSGYGIDGRSNTGIGVNGFSLSGPGVVGYSDSLFGVAGHSVCYIGVAGSSDSGTAVHGYSHSGYAAYLEGKVYIRGPLCKPGGSFKIDHPLDPANKYLRHSFVESPDMKNVYDGVVTLDGQGEAEIELPDWFGALNRDFRYQLTAIGAPGPSLHIAEEISDTATNDNIYSNKKNGSHFMIAGGSSGMKVSWQVTGIRKDPWANANRIQVEEDKPAKERGCYIYPELYGQPAEKDIRRLVFAEENKNVLISENKMT